MSNVISVIFYIKRARINSKGLCLVICRITYDGRRSEFSTGKYVEPDKWNPNDRTSQHYRPSHLPS
ncbi:Arm DNA-binding domain-containing protein [Robertkochia solimangrovi]|uniref:Arm DNA-binding domain-containing protein n=1 Tax=Robertkochia solimangrovi TaxID=2213046 RepID=UPI00117ED441|nr:hypothetical protein DMZ48_02490 [Robertkochia solimangrovi]